MKLLNKILSFISVFLLIFYQVYLPVTVLAQEATPSASPEQTVEPSPFPSETPIPSVEPSPTPIPSLDESLTTPPPATDSAVIDTSTTENQSSAFLTPPVWQTNSDSSATTTDPVTLNTTYKAPQNDKVTVTFTKLPENPGTLTIKEVKLTSEQQVVLGAFSDTAYDITSTMVDGTFEYTLTLPTPTNQNVEVKYSEDGQNFTDVSGETMQQDTITITGLTHFTIFVVVGEIDSDNNVAEFDESGSDILINEFVYDTIAPQDVGEWVELYNRSENEVDLTDWRLEDGNNIDDDIDLSGTIPAGGFAVFENNAWLNNTGDTINLLDNNGDLVNQVSYKSSRSTIVGAQDVGNVAAGQSVGRISDGNGTWDSFPTPTQGESNRSVVYVDVNGSGNGYGTQNNPFFTIGEGINAVPVGATVNVLAGTYEEDGILVDKENLSIIGPGIEEGVDRAYFVTDNCSSPPDAAFHLHADNITLSGLDIDGNGCTHVVHIGDLFEVQVAGVTVSENAIHGGTYGTTISWGSTNNSENPNVVSDNEIYENNTGVLLNSASNNKISSNRIHNNSDSAVELIDCLENGVGNCNSSAPSGNSITGNTIENNGEEEGFTGIHIFNGGEGNEAHENTISDNGSVGVSNEDEENEFDATKNYWGAVSGPLHETLNPDGAGNSVSNNVLFRPFYTDEEKETLSTNSVNPEDLEGLLEAGSFSISDDDDEVGVNEDVIISVSDNGGISSVTLPAGTTITRTDGGDIDLSELTTDDVTESSLAGLGTGVVADAALQWGLDNIELTFDPAITLSVFVGTSLNGQTLDIRRSTSGSSGWTSDGIVAPATCVVTDGLCTFQATKASFYAATHTTPTPAPSATQALSPANGSVAAPICNDQKPGSAPTLVSAPTGANSVTLNWNKALDPVTYYLATYGLTSGIQQYGNPNIGGKETTSYTVQNLSGGTTYYFKVRAGNGCAPGDFSNELSATPGGAVISGPAAGFAPGVLGATTTVEDAGAGEVQGEATPSATEASITASPPGEAGQGAFPVKTVVVIVIVLLLGFGAFRLLFK